MALASKAELRAAWQRLARRNRWTLVDDAEEFLREAEAACATLEASGSPAAQAERAVMGTYGRLTYRLLVERAERAFEELHARFYHMALRREWSVAEAQDIAAEAIVLVMTNLHQLRSPDSLHLWALNVYRSAQGQLIRLRRREQPLPTNAEGEERDLVAPGDMAETIEDRIVSDELREHLAAAIPNPRRRDILLRWVVFQETPKAIAAAYGVEGYIVRNEKRRAVLDAQKHEPLMRLLRELAALSGLEIPQGGGTRDEP